MEDKRDVNKSKRSRNEHVKNIVHSYLQKRNYAIGFQENSTIDQQITYTLVENSVSRPNSILYSCYNSDPVAIDQNFTKFVSWMKDSLKNNKDCQDIEHLVAPLFCHLYLDILKGGHSEPAAAFLKAHLPAIDKTKCDGFVKDLINLFANECDATCMIEQFRSHKYVLELTSHSLDLLQKFVLDTSHVVFLHIFQTWFDFEVMDKNNSGDSEATEDVRSTSNGVCPDNKFKKMLDAIQELEKEPKQIFQLNITYTNEPINCALINRTCGLIAYNQANATHLRSIHSYDPILTVRDCTEIKLHDHTKQINSMKISPDLSRLVTASEDSTLCIYDLNNFQLIKTCSGHLGPIYCICIGSNNCYVASGSFDTTGRLWNLDTGQNVRVFVGHTQAITSIDFHPNCLYVASGSNDRNVRLWSVDNGSPLRLFHGCKGVVYDLAFNPIGDTLVTVSDDKKIRLWDILSSKINSEIKYKSEPVTKMIWSKDGKQLCTGSLDRTIRVYDFNLNQDSGSDSKNQEPSLTVNVNSKILALEYSFDTFACVTV